MKKTLLGLVLILVMVCTFSLSTNAYNLVNLKKVSGSNLTYRGTSTVVQIADQYELNGTEFRGAWVSPFVSDMAGYSSVSQWKAEVADVLSVFKYYNLNAMIFHVRTHNNAVYKSELNPAATFFSTANFDVFDPLAYLIEECHKEGIEFHAWMNPYRVSNNTNNLTTASTTGQYIAEAFPSVNPASNTANLIAGTSGVILNPGLPNVREFLVDTCMELAQNYDIDAIHFDDYFYISGANDTATRNQYNTTGMSLGNWRREQINLFIEALHNELTAYNTANNKAIQLGIAPTGIYKNGNGTVASGSNTAGFSHYDNYLYADTYKWAKEGWIDYLLPQSYWSFELTAAGYADVMSWWNKAFAGLDCLLYSGIGYYMADSSGNASWSTNMNELANQLKYLITLENVSGYCLYSFKYARQAYKGGTLSSAKQLGNAKSAGCFADVALVPEITNMTPIKLSPVADLQVNGRTLTWTKNNDAKAYVIYRSTGAITYDSSEVVDVVGGSGTSFTWTDTASGTYYYDVVPMSRTNTLSVSTSGGGTVGGGTTPDTPEVPDTPVGTPSFTLHTDTKDTGTEVSTNGGVVDEYTIQIGYTRYLYLGPAAPDDQRLSYTLSSSNPEVADISKWGTITAYSEGTTVIRAEYTADPTKWGELTITVYAEKGTTFYTVTFKDSNGSVLSTQSVAEGKDAVAPTVSDRYEGTTYYKFTGWDKTYTNITSDLTVTAVYQISTVTVIIGDVNNSKSIDSNDAIYLLYHVMLGAEKYPVNQTADYNGDGILDSKDAVYLLYHVMFGAEKYPLKG